MAETNVAEKLTTIAENVPKVYEAGKSAEWNRFWDIFQVNGERGKKNISPDYTYAFKYWSPQCFYPKYDICCYTSYLQLFEGFNRYGGGELLDLTQRLEECGVKLDLYGGNTTYRNTAYIFSYAGISRVPELDFRYTTGLNSCFNDSYIKTIDKIIAPLDPFSWTNAFARCYYLKNIVIEGTIFRSVDFSYSPLTVESMKSIISCLKDYSGTDSEDLYSVLFTDDCWNNLEADSTAPDGGTWRTYVDNLGWLT